MSREVQASDAFFFQRPASVSVKNCEKLFSSDALQLPLTFCLYHLSFHFETALSFSPKDLIRWHSQPVGIIGVIQVI